MSNLKLAIYSMERFAEMREQTGIEYGRRTAGTLRIFRDSAALEQVAEGAGELLNNGLRYQTLTSREVVQLEPGLLPIETQLAGAVHYPGDESGDALQFCVRLTEYLRAQGVHFEFGSNVLALDVGKHGCVVRTALATLSCERIVVAAATESTALLARVGVTLPVRPAKGYSVTIDSRGGPALRIPVIDDQMHAVVAPMDGRIRVAGTAEFAGNDRSPCPARVKSLIGLVRGVLPTFDFDPAQARAWNGLRAMSADGVPIIGATSLSNLVVNTGHGHLGWTMAAGSGRLLADLIGDRRAAIDPSPFSLRRFS